MAIKVARELHDKHNEALANTRIGYSYHLKGDYDKSILTGYRYYVKQIAFQCEITGYVFYCSDRSVEIMATGGEHSLDEFIKH